MRADSLMSQSQGRHPFYSLARRIELATFFLDITSAKESPDLAEVVDICSSQLLEYVQSFTFEAVSSVQKLVLHEGSILSFVESIKYHLDSIEHLKMSIESVAGDMIRSLLFKKHIILENEAIKWIEKLFVRFKSALESREHDGLILGDILDALQLATKSFPRLIGDYSFESAIQAILVIVEETEIEIEISLFCIELPR